MLISFTCIWVIDIRSKLNSETLIKLAIILSVAIGEIYFQKPFSIFACDLDDVFVLLHTS